MKITKYGHCCLLVEEKGVRILIDPGVYNAHPDATEVDLLLITHEHADHCHLESVKKIIETNPGIEVLSQGAVADILLKEGISVTVLEDGDNVERRGVRVGSRGHLHAHIHPDIPTCINTGFILECRLFFPGDCFHAPGDVVEILALPVAGPWMKLEEAIEYAKSIKPKTVFPVHDGMLRDEAMESSRMHPRKILEPLGIEFRDMRAGSAEEF